MMWDGKRTKPVNNNSTNRKEGEVFKAQRRLQKPKFLDPPFLFPNPHSPIVARSIEMVHRPEPIGRRWWDRDRGRVGLGIAVALDDDDDDAGPSPRNPHTAAPITIRSPRVRCGSSVRTGRAGFSVGFCGGARAQVGDSPVAAAEESCAADFLSNCYVCRKKLHGEDIFMYRLKIYSKFVIFPTSQICCHTVSH